MLLRLHDILRNSLFRPNKVSQFARDRLLNQRLALEGCGDERGALVGILGGKIPSNGAALIDYESVIILERETGVLAHSLKSQMPGAYEVWNEAKGLLLKILFGLVLPFEEVDRNELIGKLLLVKNSGDPSRAG